MCADDLLERCDSAERIGEDASLTIRKDSGEEIVVKSGDVQAVAYEARRPA